MKYEGVNFRNFWSICPGMPLVEDGRRLASMDFYDIITSFCRTKMLVVESFSSKDVSTKVNFFFSVYWDPEGPLLVYVASDPYFPRTQTIGSFISHRNGLCFTSPHDWLQCQQHKSIDTLAPHTQGWIYQHASWFPNPTVLNITGTHRSWLFQPHRPGVSLFRHIMWRINKKHFPDFCQAFHVWFTRLSGLRELHLLMLKNQHSMFAYLAFRGSPLALLWRCGTVAEPWCTAVHSTQCSIGVTGLGLSIVATIGSAVLVPSQVASQPGPVALWYHSPCVAGTTVSQDWCCGISQDWCCGITGLVLRYHRTGAAVSQDWCCGITGLMLRYHRTGTAVSQDWCCGVTGLVLRYHRTGAAVYHRTGTAVSQDWCCGVTGLVLRYHRTGTAVSQDWCCGITGLVLRYITGLVLRYITGLVLRYHRTDAAVYHRTGAAVSQDWYCGVTGLVLRYHRTGAAVSQDWCCGITGLVLRCHRTGAAVSQDWCCGITGLVLRYHRTGAAVLQDWCCGITGLVLRYHRTGAAVSQDWCCGVTGLVLRYITGLVLRCYGTGATVSQDWYCGVTGLVLRYHRTGAGWPLLLVLGGDRRTDSD